ncbi:hypothetical protein COCC4DRAFT_174849 [Bipolaris maydis ATCC 48331]|uniref:Exocyst complex component Sec8 n=3 Tax=Cochliobolus heterostrophus TaxID=5016 RepID=M2UDY0_COCH5|nr:uncharacterized protein COCC4DRAFT_174849 [Bipolaris maydis ATCC 48331]EMD91871.1 hypothetical protein COCHEDRAFT_1193488 [Bipolaris maydis C5]ENI02645.1 hypothetical protein COCC4DRAFT_174849 [Bipolaris maydis ATCC 48331]KAJ6210486.1 Sec8 exocyst complex component-specific domain-containing protein [Bipolaris maydis]
MAPRTNSNEGSPAKGRPSDRQNGSRPRNTNYGPGSQAIEEVLQFIRQNWDFMTKDQCVPIEVALKLMDSSSLGLANQADQFQQTHQQLQNALKGIVNEHHQGFNSSIGTFHQIQSSLQSSQHRVRTLKSSLISAKSQLSTAKPELREFATTSQNYDGMLQMLDTIEKLQLVPERLEARISEKRFLTAVDILQDALRMIRKTEMEKIGALSDLRTYLSNQEVSLTDILIEELHSHLYLKSPYCEDRWKEYAHNQVKGDLSQRAQSDARGRLLYYFLDGLDTSEPMTDDSAHNPESDTFQYIRLVIEALEKMNRLEVAIDTIEQRLPVELFKVVEKSNNEVAQRHPSILRAYSAKKNSKSKTEIESEDVRTTLLNDLMWTLYARFEAIAESHRVVHDVVAGIVRREGRSSSATLTRGFKELWKLYQSEIRSLLHDYLATDGEASYRDGQAKSSAASAFSRAPRDKNKRMFKLTDVDTKASDLAKEKNDLELILKTSVPGLVSDSKRLDDVDTNNTTNLDGSATGHKLLVEPSVFNMGILLPPSLDFLNRLKEVVPSNAEISLSTLTSFLDDFLVNVFLPQLDETLIELCAQTFIELDAFAEDPQWARHSKKPIFKGTSQFFSLITAFCKMLDNLPHDQAFSQLIVNQMDTYAQKCIGWYKALVGRSKPTPSGRLMKAPAVWAESDAMEELIARLEQIDPSDQANLNDAIESEVALLIEAVEADEPLDQADMIQDKKSIINLCLLYTSMKWLATKTAQLRYISDRASAPVNIETSGQKHNRRWTKLASSDPRPQGAPVYLPLSTETAAIFDAVVVAYRSLSTRALRTLHLAIRSTILYSLDASMQPNIYIDTLLNDPDPTILTLNSNLVSFDTEVSTYIPTASYSHITRGLASLMDRYLFTLCTSKIERMNTNGCALMQLNILVLQQNLKNIEEGATLPYAALFFDLFTAGPEAIVARARQYGKGFGVPGERFGEEDVKKLLQMAYEERLNAENREASVQAKRSLDAQLLELSEFMY